jgi:hypothetical protein
MKKIIYTRPDGGVSIIHPTGVVPIEAVFAKDVPSDAINPMIIDESEIPSDRSNRNEWIHKNGKVEIDPVKLQAKLDKQALKDQKKIDILGKLKISESDLSSLKEIIKG